eukprot:m.82244 g.82244  ORF g.82244 m.82244 type:complete len:60 (+) comp8663_c0_seq8:1327-1506(+)
MLSHVQQSFDPKITQTQAQASENNLKWVFDRETNTNDTFKSLQLVTQSSNLNIWDITCV